MLKWDVIVEDDTRKFAMDPVTLMINECNVILLAMRRADRWAINSVASILGSGDLFSGSDSFTDFGVSFSSSPASHAHGVQNLGANSRSPKDSGGPLQQSFLRLRAILSETKDLDSVDSLTLLQPFMLTIESSFMSSTVTALALNTVSKLLLYEIISTKSKNSAFALVQLATSLTHCRFEASDQNSDDSVLLKVIRLLETIVNSQFSSFLPNAVMSEVIHTCLSLACNKRRSEVLRRASEMAMINITIRVFQHLREFRPESSKGEDIPANFAELNSEVIGGDTNERHDGVKQSPTERCSSTVDIAPKSPRRSSLNEAAEQNLELQFDIRCINEFLGFLISMISPSNQFEHMELSRVFALTLITSALEVSGDLIPQHPSLMALVADPVSKDVLQIISSTDLPALLQAALQLFCTMAIILKSHLKSQSELTFSLLFRSILPENTPAGGPVGTASVLLKVGASKETIVEHISFLWLRSPSFFTELFVDFDCDFEKSDLACHFLEFLCTLALPEYAALTTDNIPPVCLDGIRSFVAGVYERMKDGGLTQPTDDLCNQIMANKMRKNAFIACTELFNEKAARGVEALYKEGFLKDPNDKRELAEFFFQKSTRLNKKVLGIYLALPENKNLLGEFMHLFDFCGLRVDEGLRIMLKAFRLPGEAQQIERVVELFADAFVSCQNSADGGVVAQEGQDPVVLDANAVFLLSFSIIMLNTDLHNPQIKRHMDLTDYKNNFTGVLSIPDWYLETMFDSIRDREIVMPEEHHGTDKWFDDAWNNLILLQTKYARDHSLTPEIKGSAIRHFDRLLFESTADRIMQTLVEVLLEALDDVIITKVMSSLDKYGQVCAHYNMSNQVDKLIDTLAGLTSLLAMTLANGDSPRRIIPTTQVKVSGDDTSITVSDMSIAFGRNYKAQLAFHVLFGLVRNPISQIRTSWTSVIRIILTLFKNCLVEPNLFGEFQKLLRLPPLAAMQAQYQSPTPRALEDFGLFQTVSSFLRSYSDDIPEPTHENIEHTKLTINLVKLVKVGSVFESVSKRTPAEMALFVTILMDSLPLYSEETSRYYECELLFLFEVGVCFALIVSEEKVISIVIERLLFHLQVEHLSPSGQIRLLTYYFLLARQSNSLQENALHECMASLSRIEKKFFRSNGSPLVQPLISLADSESVHQEVISSHQFWDILKELATDPADAEAILTFIAAIVEKSLSVLGAVNYVWLVSLLDEIASLGAIYAHYEQNKPSAPTEDEQNVYNLVHLLKRALSLMQELGVANREQSDLLLQAFAHQCFNPCRDVRNYAIQLLRTGILSSGPRDEAASLAIFDFVLFPLLVELEKDLVLDTDRSGFIETQLQALGLLCKAFLVSHDRLEKLVAEKIWIGIVRSFAVFDELNSKSPSYKTFSEQSLEDMKNVILVLQNDFLRSCNVDLWNNTWKELEVLFPGLRQEIEVPVSHVEAKEASDTAENSNNESVVSNNAKPVKHVAAVTTMESPADPVLKAEVEPNRKSDSLADHVIDPTVNSTDSVADVAESLTGLSVAGEQSVAAAGVSSV